MSRPLSKYFTFLLLMGSTLIACQPNSTNQTKEEQPQSSNSRSTVEQKTDVPEPNLAMLSTALTAEEINALQSLVNQFELGLLEEYKTKDLTQAYQFLALGFRKEILDEGRPTGLYPFKGGFNFSIFQDKAAQLSFLTDACGFQKTNQEVINYFCLKAESNFIDFYQNASTPNLFITNFLGSYQAAKQITPDMRRNLLMEPYDQIDFTNPTEKSFYVLCLLLVQAEIQAYEASSK